MKSLIGRSILFSFLFSTTRYTSAEAARWDVDPATLLLVREIDLLVPGLLLPVGLSFATLFCAGRCGPPTVKAANRQAVGSALSNPRVSWAGADHSTLPNRPFVPNYTVKRLDT